MVRWIFPENIHAFAFKRARDVRGSTVWLLLVAPESKPGQHHNRWTRVNNVHGHYT